MRGVNPIKTNYKDTSPISWIHNFNKTHQKSDLAVTWSGVIDTAVMCTAESLTPLWHAQRSHSQRCDKNQRLHGRFSRRILIHIKKKPCIRDPGKLFDEKKTRGRKSSVRVPLTYVLIFLRRSWSWQTSPLLRTASWTWWRGSAILLLNRQLPLRYGNSNKIHLL
jgi:hypothetical protein